MRLTPCPPIDSRGVPHQFKDGVVMWVDKVGMLHSIVVHVDGKVRCIELHYHGKVGSAVLSCAPGSVVRAAHGVQWGEDQSSGYSSAG